MNPASRRYDGTKAWRLAVVFAAISALEAAAVVWFDPGPSRTLAVQATAVAPFAVFHDMRWLSVYASSWPLFVVEWLAAMVTRGLLIALALRWTWPVTDDRKAFPEAERDERSPAGAPPRPGWPELIVRGTAAAVVLSVLLAVPTALAFAAGVVPVSWLLIAAVPAVLLLSLVVHPVAVRSGWWWRPIPLRSAFWVLADFVVVTAAGAVAAVTPSGWAVAVAAVTGVSNAWAWCGVVTNLVHQPAGRRPVPVVPVALAVLTAGVSWGTVAGFSHATSNRALARPPDPAATRTGKPLLVVSGYGSRWPASPVPIPGPWQVERFSYRGLSPAGEPLPYKSSDTVKPLPVLDRLLAAQVSSMARTSGQPVSIVAESEGTLVAETYLHATPRAPVGTVVLASPLLDAGNNSYPPRGQTGSGTVAASVMSLVGDAFRSSSPVDLSPYNPFLSSISSDSGQLRALAACPVRHVRQVAIVALADAVSRPPDQQMTMPTIVLPHFHAGMLSDSSIDGEVAAILEGAPAAGKGGWAATDDLISSAAATWHVPSTPSGPTGSSDPAPAPSACSTLDGHLAATVWGRS